MLYRNFWLRVVADRSTRHHVSRTLCIQVAKKRNSIAFDPLEWENFEERRLPSAFEFRENSLGGLARDALKIATI